MSDPQLRWCRLWTDIVQDPKLMMLSPADRWFYVAILAIKRSGMLDEGDEIAVSERKLGLTLRLTSAELSELKERLLDVRLIDNGWQPSGWNNRQFESDLSTPRTRKWRRQRKRSRNVPETFPKRHGNAPETEQSRAETEQIKPPIPLTGEPGLDEGAWREFSEYRRKTGKPIKPESIRAAQRKLASFGPDQAAVVDQSIANGWQGLFALKAFPRPVEPIRRWRPDPNEPDEEAERNKRLGIG